jgi:protein gp37
MSDKSAIEWTDATWNPVTGCTKVSPGCANCYIERTPAFRMTGQRFEHGRIPVRLHHDRLDEPLHWRNPRRVFVVSMGDLFHEDVPDEFIDKVFYVMGQAKQHIFQVLTKRPERMRRHFAARCGQLETLAAMGGRKGTASVMPHIWLGVSVENQRMADERIPLLLETPAAVRFLSCEPLLGPLDLERWLDCACGAGDFAAPEVHARGCGIRDRLHWVIVGGESGPGRAERKLVEPGRVPCPACADDPGGILGGILLAKQRNGGAVAMQRCVKCDGQGMVAGWRPKPEALEWLRSIRDQCQAAGVAYFLKQLGGLTPKSGGRRLDGREWNEMPEREGVVV